MGDHAAGEVRPGGVRSQIERTGIPAEAMGIGVDPGNRPTHLLNHGKQAAPGIVDVCEIKDDKM
jgi:hypothetical protein